MKKEKLKELIAYGINGVCTTGVNYLVYFALIHLHLNYLLANTLAWVAAVLFAYITNRKLVFHSDRSVLKELTSFVALRLATLLAENALLFVLIQLAGVSQLWSKLLVSVVTVLANYVLCRSKIFKKGAAQHG